MKQYTAKILTFIVMSVFLFVVALLDPDGNMVDSFNTHFDRTTYFQNCTPTTPASSTDNTFFDVIRVIDGDTIEVNNNCEPLRIRLIGINTPETVDPRKPVQCFGKEASKYAKAILENTRVRIETDASQGTRDKYGRYLGYVIMEDGTNYNLHMISEGYAYEYTHNTPYMYQTTFRQAQKDAQAAQRGLWSPKTCNGST